jgi:hypothetical protein
MPTSTTTATGFLLMLGAYSHSAAAQSMYAAVVPQQATSPSTPTANPAAQSLKSALDELKAAHGITFFYSDQLVEGKLLPKSRPTFATWQEELEYLVTKSQLYLEKLADNTYVLYPQERAPAAIKASRRSAAKEVAAVPVTGRVTQANGEGLPGVTVVVKGTTQGTSTDANGNFSFSAPEGSILVFSSVGFTSREIAVSTSPLNVVLSEAPQALDEVQVVGYGTTCRWPTWARPCKAGRRASPFRAPTPRRGRRRLFASGATVRSRVPTTRYWWWMACRMMGASTT